MPDFIEILINEGIIRKVCGPPENQELAEQEKQFLDQQINQYYKENWSHIILTIMRYKNPLVANVNQISSISHDLLQEQDIYFHIDWMKPGRHVYTIEHSNEIVHEDNIHAAV